VGVCHNEYKVYGGINMKKFVPYEKMSKKQKRELDRAKRNTWTVNPVTRKSENKKAYNRKKLRRDFDIPTENFLIYNWS